MKMLTVVAGLEKMREAREAWGKGRTEFFAAYDILLRRYIYEGCANYMGANQMAGALGVSPRTIRTKMRSMGLDPKGGKRTLNATASEAMLENAALMGIEPSEMDLTSPLAYLPMGSQLRQQLQDQSLASSRTHEDVSGNEEVEFTNWRYAINALAALRATGKALMDINGNRYDVRVELIETVNGERPYVALDDVALLLGDDAHWRTGS